MQTVECFGVSVNENKARTTCSPLCPFNTAGVYFCRIGLTRYSADTSVFPISNLKCSETSTETSRSCIVPGCSEEGNFYDSFL